MPSSVPAGRAQHITAILMSLKLKLMFLVFFYTVIFIGMLHVRTAKGAVFTATCDKLAILHPFRQLVSPRAVPAATRMTLTPSYVHATLPTPKEGMEGSVLPEQCEWAS